MTIKSTQVSVILLAAGRSERFGGDKLLHPLAGRPLAHHAGRTLSTIDFADKIVVVGATDAGFAEFGFRSVKAPQGAPISASIRVGVLEARSSGCDACLIALADMPFVPDHHFKALLDTYEPDVTASFTDGKKTVPALFSHKMFAELETLRGDQGAKSLLVTAVPVVADPAWMRDIDTRQDIEDFLKKS